MTAETVAFVFARGGSKGVPAKNLQPVGGVPLLVRAIEACRQATVVADVVVSTDDPRIAELAIAHGAHVPLLRPAELATDSSPEWLAWRHAVDVLAPAAGLADVGTFVSVPATSPLRLPSDVDAVCHHLWSHDVDMVITVTPARRSPWFTMVDLRDGLAHLAAGTGAGITRRQDAPVLWDITGVAYATTPTFIRNAGGLFDGRVGAVVVPDDRALDIDTPWDLHVADLVLTHGRERT